MDNVKIINRTPHDITILAADGVTVVRTYRRAARGEVARVETITDYAHHIGDVAVGATRWGAVIGLPAPEAGVYHIVSAVTAAAAIASGRGAADLLVPGDQVRGPEGQIIGCRGLITARSAMPHLARGAEVLVCYTPADLAAFGVAPDIIASAMALPGDVTSERRGATEFVTFGADGRAIDRPFDDLADDERAVWDRMAALCRAHWGYDPSETCQRRNRPQRRDLTDLAEAMLIRPHRRALFA